MHLKALCEAAVARRRLRRAAHAAGPGHGPAAACRLHTRSSLTLVGVAWISS